MDDDQAVRVRPTSLSISSLLNNPNSGSLSTSSNRPSIREIPLVHLSPIPTASSSDFSSYIGAVGAEYDNYIRAKQYGLQQHLQSNQLPPRPSGSIFSGTEGLDARLADQIPSSIGGSRLSFDDRSSVFSGPNDSPSSELNGFGFESSPNAVQIPAVFCEDDFELKNPRIFDLITGNTSIVAPISGSAEARTAHGSGSLLQEKLSVYMDVVETTLVSEISATGPAFFDALQDLRELQARANKSIDRIDVLRQDLAKLSADSADIGLLSAEKEQKRQNIKSLRRDMASVKELKVHYDKVLEASKTGRRQDLIATMNIFNDFISARPSLERLQVAQEMLNDIDKSKQSLGKADVTAFKETLMQDLTDDVQSSRTEDIFAQLRNKYAKDKRTLLNGSQGPGRAADVGTNLRTELEACLDSLIYTGQLQAAYSDYQDAIIKEIRAITKRSLPANDDDDVQSNISGRSNRTAAEKSSNLAKALRNLTGAQFNSMLMEIYTRTCVFVRRVSFQQKLLIDLISSSTRNLPIEVQTTIYATHLANTIVDVCQARIVKLLNVRTTSNLDLTIAELYLFYELNTYFNAECESLTGQLGASLQSVVATQIKSFYRNFAETLHQSVIATIEMDTWQPASLNTSIQETINSMLDATVVNPVQWATPFDSYKLTSEELTGSEKGAVIEGKKFLMPLSAAALLKCLEQLMSLAQLFFLLRIDCLGSTIEVLKLYNSRSCQLILGAGATRSAGLERITAKHLAVTSQALAIVSILIPTIKAHFTRLVGSSTLLVELDKLLRLYEEHRGEIHAKLISIMEDRTTQICKQLADWLQSGKPEEDAISGPSTYMTALVKVSLPRENNETKSDISRTRWCWLEC